MWSHTQKLEAGKLYLLSGNLSAVSVALQIPYRTLVHWKNCDWWKDQQESLKSEANLQLSASLRKVAEKALMVTEDRLDKGNYQYDQKSGELIRIPVNIRDASRVAKELMEQHLDLEQKPDKKELESTIDDRLKKLADAFKAFAVGGTKTIEAVKTEYTVESDGTDSASS
jgi:hypothetical protein